MKFIVDGHLDTVESGSSYVAYTKRTLKRRDCHIMGSSLLSLLSFRIALINRAYVFRFLTFTASSILFIASRTCSLPFCD
jgi:hypothetical protein